MCLPPDENPSLLPAVRMESEGCKCCEVYGRIGTLSSGSRQLNLTRSLHPEPSGCHGPMLFTPELHSHSRGIIVSCFSNSSTLAKAGGSHQPFEADSSLSLGSRLRASETFRDPKESEILQYKVWELQKNGQESAAAPATPAPAHFSSPFRAASGGDTVRTFLSKNGPVVSSTSSPTISMPVHSDSIEAYHPIDRWKSSRSKKETSRNSSCVKDLTEDDRINNPGDLKHKLGASTGKSSTVAHHKERHYNNRPAASNKEIFVSNKDVDMSITVADIDDPSDDKDEGGPGFSEKRRKRMLSNRASAQRSRLRRQERLDKLEVLVAELRVGNAALSRRANNAATAAKKIEEENTALRDRLRKQEPVPLSDSKASNESDKTTEKSNVEDNNKIRSPRRPDIGPPRNDLCNHLEESCPDNNLSRASSGALTKERGDEAVRNSRGWENSFTGSSSDFDFNSDLMESATYPMLNRTEPPENSGGVDVKNLYQSEITNLVRNQSSQGRDPFAVDFEQCYLEMGKSEFDSRSVEDVWLESLAKCLE